MMTGTSQMVIDSTPRHIMFGRDTETRPHLYNFVRIDYFEWDEDIYILFVPNWIYKGSTTTKRCLYYRSWNFANYCASNASERRRLNCGWGIIKTGLPHHIHRYCLSTNLKKKTYLIISKTFEYLISVRSFRIGGCFNKRPKTRANRECLRPIKLCLVQLLLVFTYSACVSVTSMTFVNSTKRTFAHVFPEKKQLIMLTNKFIKPLIKISLVII